METDAARSGLVGRQAELAGIREWIEAVHAGPAALVISGEAGIGKTTVWEAALGTARAADARVLVARPAEDELPLGYAGLGDLLGPVAAEVLPNLPSPLATALSAALSIESDVPLDDPTPVARATLACLRWLAEAGPVVVAIDDVQWLDPPSARALAFAARRLETARVGIAIAVRAGHDEPLSNRGALPKRVIELPLTGLSLGALGVLLRSRIDPALPRHRLVRVHERSGGNPFFALELAGVGDDTLPSSLEDVVARRLRGVPRAAMPAIEFVAVRGPTRIGAAIDNESLDAAVDAGILLEQAAIIRFSHPLLATGAYRRIPPGRRRALHRQAAQAADSLEDRARHLALATVGPADAIAAELDRAAAAARARGASLSAVELADHAVRLTPPEDSAGRARRLMDQADFLVLAANEPAARGIVDQLLAGGARGATRVRALMLAALTETRPEAAVASLEEAVGEPHDDPLLAARALAQLAWQRGAWLGDLEPALAEALRAVERAEALDDPATLVTALTTAGLVSSVAGTPGAEAYFRRALDVEGQNPRAAPDHTPRLAFAHERWWRGDFATAQQLLDDEWRSAEQQGDDGLLMRLYIFGADLAMYRGEWDASATLLDKALVDARDYWRSLALTYRAILGARRGEPAAHNDAEQVRASAAGSSDPVLAAAAHFADGLLEHAEGRVSEAARLVVGLSPTADRSGSRGAEFAVYGPEAAAILVEAGFLDEANAIAERLERRHVQLEPWGGAAAQLCRGLSDLATGSAAAALAKVQLAAATFERLGSPWELGQSRLVAGIALRRLGRRRDAAAALDDAVAQFEALGAMPALGRAKDELRRARPRASRADDLTAAERRVAAKVAEGRTNREVAANLYTTVATVEAHLTRVYAKLGIRSRSELTRRVVDGSVALGPMSTDDQAGRQAPSAARRGPPPTA